MFVLTTPLQYLYYNECRLSPGKVDTRFSHNSCHQKLSDTLIQCSCLLIFMCKIKIQANFGFLFFVFLFSNVTPTFHLDYMKIVLLYLNELFQELPGPWVCTLVYCPFIRFKGRDKPSLRILLFISCFAITLEF